MNTCKDLIKTYASKHKTFGKHELWNWLRQNGEITSNTMTCMLTRMVSGEELCRVARGEYALFTSSKSAFHVVLNDLERNLDKMLRQKFPFATFCIYNGRSLSPLQHHISENNVTYIETERYAVDSVFDYLKSEGCVVWQNPNSDFMYKYVNLKDQCVIVKPLITEAPTEMENGILVPTLEKLLVDIETDSCFEYLHGVESGNMWDKAKQLYNINQTRLKRYAQRRGLKWNIQN